MNFHHFDHILSPSRRVLVFAKRYSFEPSIIADRVRQSVWILLENHFKNQAISSRCSAWVSPVCPSIQHLIEGNYTWTDRHVSATRQSLHFSKDEFRRSPESCRADLAQHSNTKLYVSTFGRKSNPRLSNSDIFKSNLSDFFGCLYGIHAAITL